MDIARAAFTVDLTFEPCCVYYHPMTPRACYKYMCRLFRGTERAAIRGPPSPVGCAPAAGGAPTLPLRPAGARGRWHTELRGTRRQTAQPPRACDSQGYNLSSKSQVSCPPRPASLAVPLLRVVRACPHNTVNVISPQKDSHKWRAGPFNLASQLIPFSTRSKLAAISVGGGAQSMLREGMALRGYMAAATSFMASSSSMSHP